MIVLDSHIWYWWLMQAHHRLPAGVQRCIELLPLTDAMCVRATLLTEVHRDPFDRIIIATTLELNARLASADSLFTGYPELHGHLI